MTFHVWFRLLSSVPLIYSFLNLTDGLAFSDNDTYTHVDENWFKLVCRIGINDHNTNSTQTLVSMKIGYTELASDAHVDHVLKGLVQVVAHLLDLHLLREQIFLLLVDPDIEPLNVHLSILSPVVAGFQLLKQLKDLRLELLLSLESLFLSNLQGLQILTNHLQLLLEVLDLLL